MNDDTALSRDERDELDRQFWELAKAGDRVRFEAWVSGRRGGRPLSLRERWRMWQAWRQAQATLKRASRLR